MGRVSGEIVLGLPKDGEDTAADCRNAAKLRTASRRPSGAFEESAEVIIMCSATEAGNGTREGDQSNHCMSARRRSTLFDKGSGPRRESVQVLRGWEEIRLDFS
jgi:hypothetical protein